MDFTTNKADLYIEKQAIKTDKAQREKYHFMAPCGWINDPNGLAFYKGNYHFFYQYNPYAPKPSYMHWGHASSKDLIHFENLPVALAPDGKEESGCFSGSAIVDPKDENHLILIYTRHFEKGIDGKLVKRENQFLVHSYDGLTFEKEGKPCIDSSQIPENSSKEDFRDPTLVYENGVYYAIVGSKDLLTNQGQLLIFKSSDLKKFEYWFKIGPFPFFGDMAECPNFFRIDGKDVILLSACHLAKKNKRFNNENSSLYLIGKMNFEEKNFTVEKYDEIDGGTSFYAPQTLSDDKGRRIMVAWMEMWDKKHFTDNTPNGWVGAFTIPRILSIKKNELVSTPIDLPSEEVKSFDELPKCLNISFTSIGAFEIIFKDLKSKQSLVLGRDSKGFFIDDSSTACPLGKRYSKHEYHNLAKTRALIDTSSIEVFIGNGGDTITNRFYLSGEKINIKFKKKKNIKDLSVKEIKI